MSTKIPMLFNIMKQNKITYKQLGDAIGVSSGNVGDWKSGRAAPNIEVLPKIADYLGCSVDYLLGRSASSSDEKKLLSYFNSFNDEGKEKLLDTASDMSQLDRYKKRGESGVAEKEA